MVWLVHMAGDEAPSAMTSMLLVEGALDLVTAMWQLGH